MIWFTADLHGYHKNIAGPKVSQWKEGYRDFADELEMTTTLINTLNKYVKYTDTLYSLGDWTFGGAANIKKMRDQIHCRVIHHLLGNHCDKIIKNKEIVTDLGIFYPKDCFSSVNDTLTLDLDGRGNPKRTIFMSHYAHRVWPGSHKEVIHLYGHSHGSIPDYGKSMDVGVDSIYNRLGEYRPLSLDEVLEIMDKKEVAFPDHHDSQTNMY